MRAVVSCASRHCGNLTASRGGYCYLHTGEIAAPGVGIRQIPTPGAVVAPRMPIIPSPQMPVMPPIPAAVAAPQFISPAQAVMHPLLPATAAIKTPPKELKEGETECCVCYDGTDTVFGCGHSVCLACLGSLQKYQCPICQAPLSGAVIPLQITQTILDREDRAREETIRRNAEIARRMAQDPNYNPNEHYGI